MLLGSLNRLLTVTLLNTLHYKGWPKAEHALIAAPEKRHLRRTGIAVILTP